MSLMSGKTTEKIRGVTEMGKEAKTNAMRMLDRKKSKI